jgi:hypothetical protein
MASSSFVNHVHLLSTTRHIRDVIPSSPPEPEADGKKHPKLLDDIALLLVTKPKWDVCAVTMSLTNQRIEFFYAKNAPCGRDLQPYICHTKQILSAKTSMNIMSGQLLILVLQICVEKVRSRIVKVQLPIAESPQLCSPLHLPPQSKKLCGFRPRWENMKNAEIIASGLTEIRDYNISLTNLRNDIEDVMLCIHGSYCIGRVAHISFKYQMMMYLTQS